MSKFAQRMCNFVGSVNFYKAVRRPLPVRAVFDVLFVGDDILGVPFVWHNVTLGSLREGAPARAGGGARETRDVALVLKYQYFFHYALSLSQLR